MRSEDHGLLPPAHVVALQLLQHVPLPSAVAETCCQLLCARRDDVESTLWILLQLREQVGEIAVSMAGAIARFEGKYSMAICTAAILASACVLLLLWPTQLVVEHPTWIRQTALPAQPVFFALISIPSPSRSQIEEEDTSFAHSSARHPLAPARPSPAAPSSHLPLLLPPHSTSKARALCPVSLRSERCT